MNDDNRPTRAQVRQRRCFRCGRRPSYAIWQLCADGRRVRPLCKRCDVALNAAALRWVKHPNARALMTAYRRALAEDR